MSGVNYQGGSEVFDPYLKWLGIPLHEQPPHNYRLLGLRPLETDEDVISNAVDQRMAFVRTFQAGANSAAATKILNELAQARVCLLNPATKAEYDRQLQAWFESTYGTAAGVVAATVPPESEELAQFAQTYKSQRIQSRLRGRAARKSSGPMITVIVGLVVGAVLIGIGAWYILQKRRLEAQKLAPKPPVHRQADPKASEVTAQGKASPTVVAEEERKQGCRALLVKARAAIAERNMDEGERLTKAAMASAQGAEVAEANRVRQLYIWVDFFWKLVRAEIKDEMFEDGNEIRMADGKSTVLVQAKDDQIVVRLQDQQRENYTLKTLPAKVAEAIAIQRMPPNAPERPLILGAFWALDGQGDRDFARFQWERGGDKGKELMVELKGK